METYRPKEIEQKWQEKWLKDQSFAAAEQSDKPKYYILDMFPYPSAQGLHVGHPEGYTATDIVARYKRMCGFNVLHPMGWDAFGLPAENFAIKTGVHPDQSTHDNITNFRRQIRSLGFSYDWSREVDTSSPEYYKWTQWMFLQMYEHGLAYKKMAKVNWCNTCQTVLANEQVVDGMCERSKDAVVQKDLEQWFFKITQYAEQLLHDLDGLDWPEPIKLMQRNWIGQKDGVVITHAVKELNITLETFSAYPAWLYADTFIVLAPEHPAVQQLAAGTAQAPAVAAFVEQISHTPTAQRGAADKEKLGVFTGRYAIDPFTGHDMPIWIANFALMDFGTGVIRCSAHDLRDYEFAQKYNLPLREVVERIPEQPSQPVNAHGNTGVLQDSGEFSGSEITPQLIEAMICWIEQQRIGRRERSYHLRDWLISRQRYWGAPIPIVYDPDGKPHPVKPEQLPLELPTDVDYVPKGTSPLGSSAAYRALAEKLYGPGWHFEVDTMDTFVCSSWYYLRYCDPQNSAEFAAQDKLKQWLPVDMYVGGAEHAVLHLLYARFFHKALQDFGFIPTSAGREPFTALRNQGIILGPDNQKMSKSRGNVINPDDVVNEYGADTLRMYEMFIGPFEDAKPWSTDSIKGIRRFLDRVWQVYMDHVRYRTSAASPVHSGSGGAASRRLRSLDPAIILQRAINGVTHDIEHFKFNTAISTLMICVNEVNAIGGFAQDQQAQQFLKLLRPFAPHIAAELSERCFGEQIFNAWPEVVEVIATEMTVTVQVNGKMRAVIMVSADSDEAAVKAAAYASNTVKKFVEGKQIVKEIYVPGKIYSIVVR